MQPNLTSRPNITALILTYNEEVNIGRCLDSLFWVDSVIVVDSFSDDSTLSVVNKYPFASCTQRQFDTHARQWNFGLSKVQSEWVLSLDADYIIGNELRSEILNLLSFEPDLSGYKIPFKYFVFGKPIRATILPPRLALFRHSCGVYIDDGHTQDLKLTGSFGYIKSPLVHDDRKPLARWLWAQNRYVKLEVDKLLATRTSDLSVADKIRKNTPFAPFAVFLLCLFWHRGILDGHRGLFYASQRMYAETLLLLMLWDTRHGN